MEPIQEYSPFGKFWTLRPESWEPMLSSALNSELRVESLDKEANEDFRRRISKLGGSSFTACNRQGVTPLVFHWRVGTGLTGQIPMTCGPHHPVLESLTLLSRAGVKGMQYLPVLCPVSSTDCLIQSWVWLMWNNFRSSSSKAMSPQKTAGKKKQKWINLSWRSRNEFTSGPEGIGNWVVNSRKDSPTNQISSWA